MKIKPGGKIALFLILGVVIFFVIKRYMPQDKAAAPQTTSENVPANTENKNAPQSGNTSAKAEAREFHYTPEKPVNGVTKGVVEVGASGFNSFIINMDTQKRWEIVSKKFGESLAYEGAATTEDIRLGLKKYLAGMFEKGVSPKNMHFVISSGAQKEPKTAIIANELKKMGYVVNLVTPDQEGKFGLKATLPPSFVDNSFVLDIGSGNTKIAWYDNGNLRTLEAPGAKYYEKETPDEVVYNEVKNQLAKVPESKRNVCFVLGGVPFTLANKGRKGEERYTVLNLPGTYTPDDKKMSSGLNIYKAVVDATKCDTFVFDWDANFTIGFLLSLPS